MKELTDAQHSARMSEMCMNYYENVARPASGGQMKPWASLNDNDRAFLEAGFALGLQASHDILCSNLSDPMPEFFEADQEESANDGRDTIGRTSGSA